jgi:hypothetical protein
MATTNPYAAPKAKVADAAGHDGETWERLKRVASGQRLIIYSLLVQIVSVTLQGTIGIPGFILGLAASIMAIVGVVRITGGLGRSLIAKIVYIVAMFIPLINLIAMLLLSSQATKALREAGLEVGFLGAKASQFD